MDCITSSNINMWHQKGQCERYQWYADFQCYWLANLQCECRYSLSKKIWLLYKWTSRRTFKLSDCKSQICSLRLRDNHTNINKYSLHDNSARRQSWFHIQNTKRLLLQVVSLWYRAIINSMVLWRNKLLSVVNRNGDI